MSMYYKGKEPCQGCKMPGNRVSRPNKDDLCRWCEEARLKGLLRQEEAEMEYITISIHKHSWRDKEIGDLVVSMLEGMHTENVKHCGTAIMETEWTGDNRYRFTVDARIAPFIKQMLKTVNARYLDLEAQKKELPKHAEDLANQERTKIFNEGVRHGRQLLIQLNNGSISLTDFEKDIQSYPTTL